MRALGLLLLVAAGPAAAQLSLSGEWAGRYHEDFGDRVPGDVQGDFTGVPFNDAARRYAEAFDVTRVAVLEHQIALLQGRTATHEELEDVQQVLKPMMTHLMTSVKELDARTEAIVRQADSRLALVERSLGLVPVADGTSALAQLQWALIRVGRGLVAAFVSPVVLPIQLAMTTWDVVTRPLRSVIAPAAVKEAPVPAAGAATAAAATGHRRSSRGDSFGGGDVRRRSAAHALNGESADGGSARIGGARAATQ